MLVAPSMNLFAVDNLAYSCLPSDDNSRCMDDSSTRACVACVACATALDRAIQGSQQ